MADVTPPMAKLGRCGKVAAFALADKIGSSPVSCELNGNDRYGRMLAICYLSDLDLHGWMVRNGWSVTCRRSSTAYVRDEGIARAEGAIIWSAHSTCHGIGARRTAGKCWT
jgi:endonuclease YncB( thermonuclease family)